MLMGISPLISPDLLAVLHRMGYGDEKLYLQMRTFQGRPMDDAGCAQMA